MRTLPLLLALTLLAIGVVAASSSTTSATTTTTAKPKTEEKSKVEVEKPTKEPTSTTKATRQSKALKPGDNRGKRTLYDFGNAGYLYPEVASRRTGYVDNTAGYYPQTGFYNGQNAIGQYSNSFGPSYSPYPQYLEAPEPIIEIIIKDANETLAEEPAQPIVTKKKKKKEKVHVFYVNYKKDQNNKLHLESPIASLNNDDNEEEEEEEEEVIQYPATPLPPVKSTTLRTIIHPDSEKFHSNSGIHVSFGAENKHQTLHILEEHDAESIQRQVVALPPSVGNTRADYGRESNFGRGSGPSANLLFGNYQQSGINYQHQQHQQQLPVQHSNNYFRPPQALVGPPPSYPKPQVQQQVSQLQPQQQQQRPSITQQQLPSTSSQTIFNKLVQQSQYYINHNQQYQQHQQSHQQQAHQQSHQQQQHQQQPHQQQQQQQQQAPQQQQYQKPPNKQVQVPFFPTIPPKSITPAPYQPVKFRPTPAPAAQVKPLPLPVKLDNVNYQQQQQKQLYQPQQQQKLPLQQQSYQFVRQPQFVQQPQFVVRSPTPPPEYYSQQKQQTQQQQQVQHQPHHQSSLSYFDIKPSKETELLKSIPKFEQHITETVHNPVQNSPLPQQQYQQQQQHQQFAYSSTRNEVIHDVPAPNLGPTVSGHYITASSPSGSQQQQSHFSSFPSEASPQPPVYAESTHGQKVMVVTPVPPSANYVTYSQYNQVPNEHVVHVNAQPAAAALQAQASTNFAQQPRQPAVSQISATSTDNSPFSVSTFHSDVFKELEQRHQKDQPKLPAAPKASPIPVAAPTTTPASAPNGKASQTLLQLPDEVPDDLRQQLFSSGILNNADISILDYDKQGDIALENLPAEHLQHFYGAGGGAQIAETNKVLTVVKPNGDKVALSEKQLDRVKQTNSLPQKQNLDVKVVRFDAGQEQSVSEKYLRTDATVVTPVDLAERQQYNRYLPLKINGAQFPIPESEELLGKRIVSVVVLAPVEAQAPASGSSEARSASDVSREVKFLGGELIKTLVKKPTKENFKRWLEKEARTDLELQSVVLLVAKSSDSSSEQEIFMYDIGTGSINRLNGELSSTFVNVAEENASTEDLEHAATLDPSSLESMMHLRRR
ncbi:uncharacterized protein Dana_GF11866 [Drosophila ananassae]|uniref:Uncharacterized protein n=1 Tax=Drosophila ananassae TaxID=7217 RepID=B3MEX8_DROAN|nr:putative uncharacterized protein DDB_G0271606 [Drosophila ananassae]XP_032306982.1 putative uncharacterized protein DDB_G0271606 [Drosophila ananassae]EDV36599.1 uncharacterized protein Dana_GF11866 [Drosophila ananassae]